MGNKEGMHRYWNPGQHWKVNIYFQVMTDVKILYYLV